MSALVVGLVVACCVLGIVAAPVGARQIHEHRDRAAARAVAERHNRIARLEIELGITTPMYADAEAVAAAWDARFGAALGPQAPPRGYSRPSTAVEQAAIEATRARRKEVARRAAQRRFDGRDTPT